MTKSTSRSYAPKASPRPRGRPVKNHLPPPILDTPENIVRAIFRTPPSKIHKYMERVKGEKD